MGATVGAMSTADKLIRIADSMSEDIAELEAANRELKWQHVTVSDDLAHARVRIAELERREVLLTANVTACERRRSYHPSKPPVSMNDAEVRAWSLEDAAIDLAVVDTYAALIEAGFPWPTEPVDAGEDRR